MLSYFDAVGAEMSLGVEVGAASFQIWGSAPVVPSYQLVEGVDLGAFLAPLSLTWAEIDTAARWWPVTAEPDLSTRSGQVVRLEDYRASKDAEGQRPREARAT